MYPGNPEKQLSHETIYAAIYVHPKARCNQKMIEMLRQHRSQRGPRGRRTPAVSATMPADLCIRHRPGEIEEQLAPDTGKANSSRALSIGWRSVHCRLKGCDASSTIRSCYRHMPACARKATTYDRRREMASHEHLARRLNGVWISADDPAYPMSLSGWVPVAGADHYEGRLLRGDESRTACECWESVNAIRH